MSEQYLFVYGTLRAPHRRFGIKALMRHCEFIGQGCMQGVLFRVAGYPGAVGSCRTQDRIRGEVYRLLKPARTLRALDRYEACSAIDPKPQEYQRVQQPIQLSNGVGIAAWVYLYCRGIASLPRISSGDFATFR